MTTTNKKYGWDDKPPFGVFKGKSVREALATDFFNVGKVISEHRFSYESPITLFYLENLAIIEKEHLDNTKEQIKLMKQIIVREEKELNKSR